MDIEFNNIRVITSRVSKGGVLCIIEFEHLIYTDLAYYGSYSVVDP